MKVNAKGRLDDLAADLSLDAPKLSFILQPAEAGEEAREESLQALTLRADGKIAGDGINAKGALDVKKAEVMGLTVDRIAAAFRTEGEQYFLERFSMALCSGTVEGKARADMPAGGEADWSAEARIDKIDMNQILSSMTGFKDVLYGTFGSAMTISGKGTDAEAITRTVKGSGTAAVKGGRIANFDLGDAVMGQLGAVPAVSKLADLGGEKVGKHKDTTFESLDGTFTLGEGKIRIDPLALRNMGTSKATGSDAVLSGTVGFDTTLDLKGKLILSQKHSVKLVGKMKEAKALAGDDGRIVLPLTITGNASAPKPMVDIQYITQAFLRYGTKKLLEDKLGIEVPDQQQDGQPKRPIEGLLKGLLEKEKEKRRRKEEKKKQQQEQE